MRADNNGEGGVLALATLAHRSPRLGRRIKTMIGFGAILGLALFYGDGMLTPAISVLERGRRPDRRQPHVRAARPAAHADHPRRPVPDAEPRHGAHRPVVRSGHGGVVRGAGDLGVSWIVRAPIILTALNPWYGVALFVHEPWTAFVALGSVVLAVTGCEALYADMGHFGKSPIRAPGSSSRCPRWCSTISARAPRCCVNPHHAATAFYSMAPHWAHYPLVAAGHLRHHHRIAGGDLRRLLDHAPGGAARPAAAHGNPPHLDDRLRPDLRAAHERACC